MSEHEIFTSYQSPKIGDNERAGMDPAFEIQRYPVTALYDFKRHESGRKLDDDVETRFYSWVYVRVCVDDSLQPKTTPKIRIMKDTSIITTPNMKLFSIDEFR